MSHNKIRSGGDSAIVSLDPEALRRQGILDENGELTGEFRPQQVYNPEEGTITLHLPNAKERPRLLEPQA